MTEAQVRNLLRQRYGLGGVERWIAGQPWEAVPGGWAVKPDLEGWRFLVEPVPEGVRITASPGEGGTPAVWTVMPRPGAGGGP
jgi:hypothetical protein